jgi:sulfoxide reductase catalytic subunit YedY
VGRRYLEKIPFQKITPPEIFFDRRKFLSAVSAGILATPLSMCASSKASQGQAQASLLEIPLQNQNTFPVDRNMAFDVPSSIARHDLTPREVAASNNNFYEFLSGRGGPVWQYCGDFEVEPWKIEITGECNNPITLDLDDLFAFDHEERVYHFRCVERWAMNVPWSGFPLRRLLERVEPTEAARYVRFESAMALDQMPGVVNSPWYPWPYHEGLRIDEAMNDLTMIVTGVYGEPLLRQHGSPIRIIVPWKYGYKSPKSIIKIELIRNEPNTFWQTQPHEYGFLSNVNPNIPHPRWPQNVSHWLDSEEMFQTPIYNGYEEYVANLYPDEPRTMQRPLSQGQIAR